MNFPFLIADDSPGKLSMLVSIVKKSGWKGDILTATNTDAAKELIDANPDIAAAFVDYNMPIDDGPAVIRYLHEKNTSAHIALVTSMMGSGYYEQEARSAGAEAIVSTADDLETIETKLSTLVDDWKMLLA